MTSGFRNEGRLLFLRLLSYLIALVFILKLINIQILKNEDYRSLADKNRTKIFSQTAPRGRILSSDGVPLAISRPSFTLIYYPPEKTNPEALKKMAYAIAQRIKEDPEKVEESVRQAYSRHKTVRLAENITSAQMMALSELQAVYPCLSLVTEARRYYPFGDFLSHLIGYTGKMSASDWRDYSKTQGYGIDSLVGKSGIEKIYEQYLKGKDGGIFLEVDYRGRMKRILENRSWVPGDDLFLTINTKAQEAAEQGLKKSVTKKGAVVAIDPRNGAILAFAVLPDYDLNQFSVYGAEKKNKVVSEFNSAIQGTYPPGSIFKIVTSAAILESGKINPEESYFCPGSYDTGNRVFKCWKHTGHGKVDFVDALTESCDVYYYIASQKIGPASIEDFAHKFQFGELTGINLPYERRGNVYGPSKRADRKSYWFVGDTLNMAIGQGETLVTPLQAAQMIASVANGGKFYTPRYLDKIKDKDGNVLYSSRPSVRAEIKLRPETWELIRKALKNVIHEGTGVQAQIKGVDIYGKTGSAQNPHGADHAWFVCYAEMDGQPSKVAVAVLVENGAHGASAAAPIAKEVVKAVLGDDLKAKFADEILEQEGPRPANDEGRIVLYSTEEETARPSSDDESSEDPRQEDSSEDDSSQQETQEDN